MSKRRMNTTTLRSSRSHTLVLLFASCFSSVAMVAATPPADSPAAATHNFDREVAPLIAQRCMDCHSGATPKGKLDLSQAASAMAGGESGSVITAGKPDESLLWEYIEGDEMPPKKPLSTDEKKELRDWIASGAKWGTSPIDPFAITTNRRAGYDWWSLQPLKQTQPPKVKQRDWLRNQIDAFVLDKLEAADLAPSPEADRRTFIRRLYFDLIGLPPSPEEIEAFVSDKSSDAYERLVDRLLASPHYGERWARHWLDVARFGESDGFERNNPRKSAWPYRDWVINALNDDMPYNEFARMQLAGDLDNGGRGSAAVGFYVAGLHNTTVGGSKRMKLLARQDELEEIVAAVGQSFLGLTVNCARCHDHKFDPISATEYYRMIAAIDGVYHGERNVSIQSTPQPKIRKIYSVTPRFPGTMRIHIRGGVTEFGDEVAPGGIQAVQGVNADFELAKDAPDAERRTKLAEWITDPDNALFTRVIVNRVWHYHFGTGIVDSPNDLGFNGGRPSHPELLDWLAAEFKQDGYKLKALHRRIVLSATYRQASKNNVVAAKKDLGNRLLWRFSPQRVEAEVLRDSILQVAGVLNPAQGGPGFVDVSIKPINGTTYYEPIDPVGAAFNRRTVYRFSPRGGRSAVLDTFDCPDPSGTAPRRSVTTTPLQALSLMNNSFVLRMSDKFSKRVKTKAGDDAAKQIQRAWRLAVGRLPTKNEEQLSFSLVEKHGLPVLCRALFNSNEFVIIE